MSDRCPKIGALLVNGKPLAAVRCSLDAGHDVERWGDPWLGSMTAAEYAEHNRQGGVALDRIEPTPHRAVLEWVDDEAPDLDLLDPDEDLVDPLGDFSPCPACGRKHPGPAAPGVCDR